MPARPKWFDRLREIIKVLEIREDVTRLDRVGVETLFHIGKRRALHLMAKLGGKQDVGGIWTIERDVLLGNLRKLRKSRNFASFEAERDVKEQRVAAALAEAERTLPARQRPIELGPAVALPTLAGLGGGIEVGATELRLRYASFDEFMRHLAAVVRAIEYDMPAFEQLMGKEPELEQLVEPAYTVELESSPPLQEAAAGVGA